MSARTQARRGTDSFVKLSRNFGDDMADCTLEEIGLMSLILTSRMVNNAGVCYRLHEWADYPDSTGDKVLKLLDGLEGKGKIVCDGNHVLIRSWVRRNCFDAPNLMKAVAYAVAHQETTALHRIVLATELLRKDIASLPQPPAPTGKPKSGGRQYARGQQAHYMALQNVWTALFDQALPAASEITGSTESPNEAMLGHIVASDDFRTCHTALEEKSWVSIHPPIAAILRERLAAPTGVATLGTHRRTSG